MELTAATLKRLWPELEWEDCVHGSYDVRGLLKPCINNIPFVSVTKSASAWVFELRAGATVLLNVVKHPFAGGRIIHDFRERVESGFPAMMPYEVPSPESAAEKLFLRDMLAILEPIAPEDTSIPHLRESVKEELRAAEDALHKLRVYAGVGYVQCLRNFPDRIMAAISAEKTRDLSEERGLAEGLRLLFKVHELTFSDRLAEATEVMKAIDALGVKEDPLYKAVRDLLYGKGPSAPANPRLERLKERVTMAILDWDREEKL